MRRPHPLATLTLSLLVLRASAGLLALRASAGDAYSKLTDKPFLTPPGGVPDLLMTHFPPTPATFNKWDPNEVPKDCVDFALLELVQKEPQDFEVYDVKYEDCATPWVFCYNKGSQITLDDAASRFGRIPVSARQFVRHFLVFPETEGRNGVSDAGSIGMFGDSSLALLFHELGHTLDRGKAYIDGQLSESQEWADAVNRDTHVSDEWAVNSLAEALAQITVVVCLDLTLRPGYSLIQPEWQKLRNQASLLRDLQAKAGNLLMPGQGSCDGRKVPVGDIVDVRGLTPAVTGFSKAGPKLRRGVKARGETPDTSLGEGLKVIPSMESETEMFGTGSKQ